HQRPRPTNSSPPSSSGYSGRGGGVYVSGGTFKMTDGTISDNSATGDSSYGGGVYVDSDAFTMEDGTISGNTANRDGGGVYVEYGTLTMKGGTISGNTANSNGGGVYFYSGTFTVSGTPVVTGNKLAAGTTNNVYLPSGMYITLSGPLTDGASVGVTTETAPTASAAVEITTAENGTAYYSDSLSYFSSDNTEYYVSANSTGNYLELGLRTALTEDDFNVDTSSETYSGSSIEKTITSPTGLVKDTDYTVTYSANKNAGTATITITGIGAYSGTLTYDFTINKKPVTPSITGTASKTYDGDNTAQGLSIELTGVVTGEDVTASAASYTYDSASIGTDKTITATGITLVGEDVGNYTLSSDTATTNGTITTKALSESDFDVNAEDETYTGSAITKTIDSDLVKDTDYTVTYNDNTNAGTATITITGKGNYSGTLTYSFTIKPITLTATINGTTTKTYDGTTTAEGLSITLSDVVEGDDVTATASFAYNSANVDEATTITASGISLSGEDAGNYTLSSTTATTAGTINCKAISKSDFTVNTEDVTYTGSAITKNITSDLVECDDYIVDYNKNKNAGTASIIITGRGNYTGEVTYTFTIDPKPLTPSISGSTTKTYDGDTTVTDGNLSIALSGIVYGDTVSASASYAYDSKNVGENKTITASSITLGGTSASNYTLSTTTVTADVGTISAKTLTASINGNTTKTYDATTDVTDAQGLSIELDGVVGSDDVTASAASYTYNSANVDEATTITASGIILTGEDAGNYTLSSDSATITGSITAKALSESDFTVDTDSVTYTGSEITNKTITTTLSADDFTYSFSNNTNAGTATITITGKGNCTGSVSYDFIIHKATPTVSLTGVQDKTYDGTAVVEPTVSVTLVDNTMYTQNVTYFSVADDGTETELTDAPSAAGSYKVVVTVDAGSNYNTGLAEAYFEIFKAEQEVKIEGFADVTYDGQAHEVTVTADDDATVTVTYTDADGNEVAAPVNAGTYTAHVTVTRDNYVTVEHDVKVSIALATQDVTVEGFSVTYDGQAHEVTVTADDDA
ncbi:MAG: YDG domain-containing protein, partial [Clostridiales bacterium]|nr:YDG domain-containing protein [Clostridiales bacterium]